MSISIVDLLVHYGADLSRVNPSRVGWQPMKCPWHEDRVSSASVNITNDVFRCHACDMKGDAISIIKEVEGLDYGAAIEYAREVLGASVEDLPQPVAKPKRKRQSARQRLFE